MKLTLANVCVSKNMIFVASVRTYNRSGYLFCLRWRRGMYTVSLLFFSGNNWTSTQCVEWSLSIRRRLLF